MKIKRFEETFAEQSPEVQAKANALTEKLLAELALGELRAARQLSQQTIAKTLGVTQPAVAKIEKRTDMYLSTLRNMITAMGGSLELIARFPEGDIKIKQLAELDDIASQEEPPRAPKSPRAKRKPTALA